MKEWLKKFLYIPEPEPWERLEDLKHAIAIIQDKMNDVFYSSEPEYNKLKRVKNYLEQRQMLKVKYMVGEIE